MSETYGDWPKVAGVVKPVYAQRVKGQRRHVESWGVVVTCPYCDALHYHGLGTRAKPHIGDNLGARVAHCKQFSGRSYEITVGEYGEAVE